MFWRTIRERNCASFCCLCSRVNFEPPASVCSAPSFSEVCSEMSASGSVFAIVDSVEEGGCGSRGRLTDQVRFPTFPNTLMFEDVDDIVIPGFSGAELRAEDFPAKLPPHPQPRRSLTPRITVHQYTYGSRYNSRSSPLDVGRRAAEMATATSGWRAMNPPVFECMPQNTSSIHPPTLTILIQ